MDCLKERPVDAVMDRFLHSDKESPLPLLPAEVSEPTADFDRRRRKEILRYDRLQKCVKAGEVDFLFLEKGVTVEKFEYGFSKL